VPSPVAIGVPLGDNGRAGICAAASRVIRTAESGRTSGFSLGCSGFQPANSTVNAAAALDRFLVWPYSDGMATQTIKTTYSLDLKTVRALETLAQRWKVSKSEALRRAIQAAAEREPSDAGRDALLALDELQRSLGLTAESAARWRRTIRTERLAAARRREARRR
jgi:hypothetical protein